MQPDDLETASEESNSYPSSQLAGLPHSLGPHELGNRTATNGLTMERRIGETRIGATSELAIGKSPPVPSCMHNPWRNISPGHSSLSVVQDCFIQHLEKLQKEVKEIRQAIEELKTTNQSEKQDLKDTFVKEMAKREAAHQKEFHALREANKQLADKLQQALALVQQMHDGMVAMDSLTNAVQMHDHQGNETQVPYQQRDHAVQRPSIIVIRDTSLRGLKNANTIQQSESSSDELTPLEMNLNIPSMADMFGCNSIGD